MIAQFVPVGYPNYLLIDPVFKFHIPVDLYIFSIWEVNAPQNSSQVQHSYVS